MNERRFEYVIDVDGDNAIIGMNCGGAFRFRDMPVDLLEAIAEMFDLMLREARGITFDCAEVPEFPDCRQVSSYRIEDICVARIVASRADGRIELIIGLYDADDPDYPVLVLVDDQIGKFVAQVQQLTKEASARSA